MNNKFGRSALALAAARPVERNRLALAELEEGTMND